MRWIAESHPPVDGHAIKPPRDLAEILLRLGLPPIGLLIDVSDHATVGARSHLGVGSDVEQAQRGARAPRRIRDHGQHGLRALASAERDQDPLRYEPPPPV